MYSEPTPLDCSRSPRAPSSAKVSFSRRARRARAPSEPRHSSRSRPKVRSHRHEERVTAQEIPQAQLVLDLEPGRALPAGSREAREEHARVPRLGRVHQTPAGEGGAVERVLVEELVRVVRVRPQLDVEPQRVGPRDRRGARGRGHGEERDDGPGAKRAVLPAHARSPPNRTSRLAPGRSPDRVRDAQGRRRPRCYRLPPASRSARYAAARAARLRRIAAS